MHGAMAADSLWLLDAVSLDPARLRDVTLAIPPGITAVLGWSGAGKTSLLNLLVGFERPNRGRISSPPNVAWVPQNGGLWPHCTAREHLELVHRSSAGTDALLAAFDLAGKPSARPDELSEGEQSRLAVARALAAKAPVLVMDEPLVHVDPARVGKYWSAIRAHLKQTSASLIFSTHQPEAVLGEAERVICLRAGAVLHEGSVASLYAHPPSAELMEFLGPGNWLTPDEARLWLNREFSAAGCLRPEQLVIEPCAEGAFVVEAARFRGSVAETTLRPESQTVERLFFHRPAHHVLRPGLRADIRVLAP